MKKKGTETLSDNTILLRGSEILGPQERDRTIERILDSLDRAAKTGERFVVSPELIREGMIVFTEDGQFPREETIKVVAVDLENGVARCKRENTGEVKTINIADLRDPNALGKESVRLYIAAVRARLSAVGST